MLHSSASSPGVVPSDLKLNNRRRVLAAFTSGHEYTANNIADIVGLSRLTAMKAIQFFVDKGLVISAGKGSSTCTGGKRPELFSLTSEKYLLCIDIWPESLNLTLIDFKCAVIDQIILNQPLSPDVHRAIEKVGRIAQHLLAQNHVANDALCGVSVSTPGIIDYKTNRLKYDALSPAWGNNVPVADMLRPYFSENTQIIMDNVAKMTARSLLQDDALQHLRVLSVFSSWGLSGCLMDKGRIMNGKDSLIGEFGHMVLDPHDSERCGCGGCGCFERLVSNARLRANAASRLREYPDSMLASISIHDLTAETLFNFSNRGDELSCSLVAELAHVFALALRNITLLFDPDLVVFQGAYANANALFRSELHKVLAEFQYYPKSGPFELRFDLRPITESDLQGSYVLLLDRLFGDTSLYE